MNKYSIGLCALLAAVGASSAQAQDFGSFQLKAKTGDPIAGTGQTLSLSLLNQPRISQTGVVGFMARTAQSSNDCLFSLQGPDQTQLARHLCEEQSTPAGDGRIQIVDRWFLADDGTITADVRLENVTQFGSVALYRASAAQVLSEVLRDDKSPAPGLPEACRVTAFTTSDLHMDRNGDLWIAPMFKQGNACARNTLYRIDRNNAYTPALSLAAAVSGTAFNLTEFDGEVIGDGNGVVFFSGRDNAQAADQWYLRRSDGAARIAADRNDQVAAGANETLSIFESSTDVLSQYPQGSSNAVQPIRRGQNVPGGPGQFFNIRDLDIAPDNRIVATVELTGTTGGSTDDTGIYLIDQQGVIEIAREGQPAPTAGAVFTNLPDFTEFANIGPGGRVLFEARYRVGNANSVRGWFYFDRVSGLREILNTSTEIGGLQVRDWSVGERFNERGELPLFLRLSDDATYAAVYRLRESFSIGAGITGAWFDPAQAGHGLFVEVLPDQRFLAWWFTFSPSGEQSWFGGVGLYEGAVAVVPLTKTTGGRFIPNFNAAAITNPPFGALTFTYTGCNTGVVEFDLPEGYGRGSMILTRLTLPEGLSCP